MGQRAILGIGLSVALLVLGASDLVAVQQDRGHANGPKVPRPLANSGEYGENIYDYAKSNDWKAADAALARLKAAVRQVRGEGEDRLERDVAGLGRSVAKRSRGPSMEAANQVTLDVANMTASLEPRVPVQVTRLDFYGRELELWSEAGDTARLRKATVGVRREWDSVGPSVERRGPREARKFGALVARVEAASTPAEYGRLAGPVLDAVDELEKVFER